MSKNRKATEEFILKWIKALTPKGQTADHYKQRFDAMSDAEFDAFMKRLETEEEFLVLLSPNFSNTGLTVENNFKIAKQLGHEFFQRLWMGAKGDSPAYLTPVKYMIVDLPLRRASQLLIKKISVAAHSKTVDALTGQPTGDSAAAKISKPELEVLASMGCDNSIVELIKYRGGDLNGHRAMNAMISRYGQTSLKSLANFSSGVESTRTLRTFLVSAHLKNNI